MLPIFIYYYLLVVFCYKNGWNLYKIGRKNYLIIAFTLLKYQNAYFIRQNANQKKYKINMVSICILFTFF